MNNSPLSQKTGALAAAACAIVMLAHLAQAQNNEEPDVYRPPEGMEVLTRGPVHEGFAEPIVFNPEPGPIVTKEPPQPIDEIPPDQKPEGENVLWIPGYWTWDDAQGDFLWVSGIWRDVPPGRQWVPGYWVEAKPENGWRRVPGTWASTEQEQVTYLPEPPETLEAGPNLPEPEEKSLWVPGNWQWGDQRYDWRPGYWLPVVADWVWVPAHYVWTPGGYLFVEGYWDRPFAQRGIVFAPVHFQQPIYTQPQFAYTPAVTLVTTILTTNLFVRPATYQYYFGDYYADRFTQNGYYPWYAIQGTRRGYDPVYAQLAAINSRQNPQWSQQLAEVYQYRRTHEDARPPSTYTALQALAQQAAVRPGLQQANFTMQNIATTKNLNIQNALLAQPIAQLAANDRLRPARFERVAPERRDRIVRQVRELREVSERRVRDEAKAVQSRPADFRLDRPRSVALPRSPIVAERLTQDRSKTAAAPGRAAAAPPPPPPQAERALGNRPGLADQKPADAEKQDRRRVLKPRADQPSPDGTPKAPPDVDATPRPRSRPDQEKADRPGTRPGTGPAPPLPDRSKLDRPALPDQDRDRDLDQTRPMPPDRPRPGAPGTDPGRPRPNRPDATSPGRPGGVRPDAPAPRPDLPDRPGGPGTRPGPNLPDRPGTRPGPNLPDRPGTRPGPNLPDRPGINRPEGRPGRPGIPGPNQPGPGRPGQPGATPGRPGQVDPRGGAQPDVNTPRDRPGAARPGLRPGQVPPAAPGAADQPGLGSPNRPGINPGAPRGGVPDRRGPGDRPARKAVTPAAPKAAADSKPDQS